MNKETKKQIEIALLMLCQFYGSDCYGHGVYRKGEIPDAKEFVEVTLKEIENIIKGYYA